MSINYSGKTCSFDYTSTFKSKQYLVFELEEKNDHISKEHIKSTHTHTNIVKATKLEML